MHPHPRAVFVNTARDPLAKVSVAPCGVAYGFMGGPYLGGERPCTVQPLAGVFLLVQCYVELERRDEVRSGFEKISDVFNPIP